MMVQKIFYNVNRRYIKNININEEESLIKDKDIIFKRQQYLCFTELLRQNKAIKKGSGLKTTIKDIEKATGMSKSTYYRIRTELKVKGFTYWKTLEINNKKENKNKNKIPKHFRVSKIPQEYKDIILQIRLENKTYSEKKIEIILFKEYNIKLSHRTIGKILKEFNKKGLINIKGSKLNKKLKPNEINNTKPRDFNNSYSKRWVFKDNSINNKTNKKKKDIDKIGTMIQIDHMKLFDRELGERFIEFSGIDATTRIKSSYIYRTATSKNAKDFLINHLIPTLPFNIKSIQVDGGSEFRKDFEKACKELNIKLYVLPPYSPKQNGRIERSNRTMREEFYSNRNITEHCAELKDWNEELEKFIYKYNHYRPHNSLDFKTPYEYYEDIIKKEGIFSQKVVG